jgi:putative NADH-flavin reductase
MKIALFGSTGRLGLKIVDQALARGWSVDSYARSAHPMEKHAGVLHRRGDILDSDNVKDFLRSSNSDVVVSALGVKMGSKPGIVRSAGTLAILEGCRTANIPRFISVGALGVPGTRADQSWLSKLLLPLVVGQARLDEAARQEELIARSGIDFLVVRAPRLTDKEGSYALEVGASLKSAFSDALTRSSLAGFILDQCIADQKLAGFVTAKNFKQAALLT